MADRRDRKSLGPLRPDYENRNPFRGLPADFPSAHSRFPIVAPAGYAGLSFIPSIAQNGSMEGQKRELTADDRDAWREAMTEAMGDLIDVPAAGDPSTDD